MYAYIKGTVEDIYTDRIVVENGGIGYNIYVPSGVMAGIGYTGREVKLYTYLHVKEDAMTLYGFLTKEDTELFKLLISVSGIGPKGAVGILGTLSADDLRFAIMSGDSKAIAGAPGIGIKTAQKVILELKDKLKAEDFVMPKAGLSEESAVGDGKDMVSEAVMALTALGYGQTEAMKAVSKCDTASVSTVEELIKAALKNFSF